MKTVPLKANERKETGKKAAKHVRLEQRIPAVLYGTGVKATSIDVSAEDFLRVLHTKAGDNVIIQLAVTGQKNFEKTVVIKEIQHHPVRDAIVHVDFNAISLTENIKVKVLLQVKGDAPGLKDGGVLDVVHHEIEVECLPTSIPERLDADISSLKIGDSIHLREISFPKGVTPLLGADEVVVAIHAPKVEGVAAPEEVQAEPEVIGKEKKPEADAEAAPSPAAGATETRKEKPAEKERLKS